MIQKIVISISEMDQAKANFGSEEMVEALHNKQDHTMRDDSPQKPVSQPRNLAPSNQKQKNNQEMSGLN